ncbi:PilZ domain-containing protein [Nitrospira sp. Nam74]
MIQRQAYRFPVKLPVTFSGEREGTGVLYDVSVKGCRIVSRTPLRIGHAVSLLIYQGAGRAPIAIATAEVRWAVALQYGLTFQSLEAEEPIRELIASRTS